LRDLLIKGAQELGVELDGVQVERFFVYLAELQKWNKKINLTSIDGEREIVVRHFLDSLTLLEALNDGEEVLDMGTGGGFPGLALKIARPALKITLMDKVDKKVVFLRHIIRTLELEGVRVVSGRADDVEIIGEFAASFDVIVSRAFSSLEEFLSLSLPYIRPGGRIIAVKGPRTGEMLDEVEKAEEAFPELELVSFPTRDIPFSDRLTTLITFRGRD
jgi:16S rRNA (guanine527-N7)-methyltransferase